MGLFDWLQRLLGSDASYEPGARTRERVGGDRNHVRKARGHLRQHNHDPKRDRVRMHELGVPAFETVAELARAMKIEKSELLWLADPQRFLAGRKPHYRLLVRPKRNGVRVLLAPRPKLARAQRWILAEILDSVPVHEAAHGFVKGRSIRTNAEGHTGREVVCQMDIQSFFHQFTYRRVVGLFRSFGYPLEVARTLALLTTAAQRQMAPVLAKEAGVPLRGIWDALALGLRRAHHPMLPQGAPTSPSIANHLCRQLDRRLTGLAQAFGASYTRYADDLAFSGNAEFRRDLRRFVPLVKRILADERLPLEPSKLRFARKGSRQKVCGVMVNAKINSDPGEYRKLRAILHNCVVQGAGSQNREERADFRAHLQGRIAFHASLNSERGAALQRRFDEISW